MGDDDIGESASGVVSQDERFLLAMKNGPREVSEVYLSGLAREVTGKLRGAEPDRAFSVDIEDGLVAEADAALCKVLLGDLLGNAWKLTAAETLAHIPVCAVGSGGRRVFCVSDVGAGFDQEYAGRLFRPFERLHVQKDFAGAGIGPGTVRPLRRLGGDCRAQGTIGQRASFFFTLSATGAGSGDPVGTPRFGAPDSGDHL